MKHASAAHYARELAWLRIIKAHCLRLGLYETAARCVTKHADARRRWSREVAGF